jgi:phosphoserine phosphatase
LPQFGPFDIAGGSYPAEATGGDYFDYLPLADGCLGVVVADATGHGVGPALPMAETRAYLRAWAMDTTDVGEILTRTNVALAEDVDFERYVTLLLAKLDPASQSLVHASAGHPNGYVLDASGRPKALLKHTGAPLGLQHGPSYGVAPAVRLLAGDIVLLVTDGIEEALSPENTFFGAQRILEVARTHSQKTAREILGALYDAVRDFSQGRPQLDDLTVVVVKVNPPA